PCAGAAATVTADGDRDAAQSVANELAEEICSRRERFAVRLPSPEQALRELPRSGKPVAIVEPSDNPLSGGVGDTTGLLRAVLEAGMPAVFAFFWDPALAARCEAGKRLRVFLGGRLSPTWGPPIELDVAVELVTEGRFRNAGPMERGLEVNLGRTAVLRARDLRVIVTSSCLAPNDPEYFRLHGIDLTAAALVCAKAKNHFRAAFGEAFAAIIDVDTPGPAAVNLAALPFRHVPLGLLPSP
ncbi:MAG: MlrC C-terminal domain-containing protein, partial [Betaproteobacteria bacterium]|nr:MlrC C-terminal domain-containing protein [Betaproteobacteria bacterium]